MFENNSARDYIEELLIAPFFCKDATFIGAEFEFPILFLDQTVSSKEIGKEFLTQLILDDEFEEEKGTCSPEIMRVNSKNGDSISFDYSYATIEFSMAKAVKLQDIAERFYRYFNIAAEYYNKKGCIISGMGSNPLMPNNIEFTRSNYTDTLREFIGKYCPQKNPVYYLTNMQSVQTHIEVPGKQLVQKFNTMCRMDFVGGLLLSNSLPEPSNLPDGISYDEGTLCARDLNWEGSGFPNTGICKTPLKNVEELIDYFTDKQLCFRRDNLDYYCFEPTSLKEYFDEQNHPKEDIKGFFNVERVTINQYNVLERRGDCIQPLKDTFCASAFNIGICYNTQKACELVKKFLNNNGLASSDNAQLRKMAITGRFAELVSPKALSTFLTETVNVAAEGLRNRGYGEESYLEPLYERAKKLQNPAEYQKQQLEKGVDILEIARQYAQC